MRMDRLNPFEKLILTFSAIRDVRREQFQLVSGETRDFPIMQQATRHPGDYSDERPAVPAAGQSQELPEQDSEKWILSPFIYMELSKYEDLREYTLGMRKILSWKLDDRDRRRLHIATFAEAMSGLDSQINRSFEEIRLLALTYEDQTRDYLHRQKEHSKRNEPHMAQLCVNQVYRLRTEYYEHTRQKYHAAISLLGEKLKLLNMVEARLLAIRGHCFHRIRYYYQCAVGYSDWLPSDYLQDSYFEKIANMSTLANFEQVREDTAQRLDALEREVAALTQQK